MSLMRRLIQGGVNMAEAVKSRITAIDSTLEPYQKDLDLFLIEIMLH